MAKTDMSVQELVGEVESNRMRLPEMQRGYVWKSTQVRDLVDSLYRGYPAGNILMWETGEEMPTRAFSVEQKDIKHSSYYLLLDGQQRITSLSKLLRGCDVKVRDCKREIDIYFNMDHPEGLINIEPVYNEENEDDEQEEGSDLLHIKDRTFIVANNKVKNEASWVSVKEVFKSGDNNVFLKKAGITNFDDPLFNKYNSRLNNLRKIKEYMFHIISLEKTMSYEEVTEIFVRVNSLGTKLKGSDLALAQITAKWRGSLELFETFQAECKKNGWNLSLGILVRALITIITGQSKFKTVSSIKLEQLQTGWEDTKRAVSFALAYLKNNMKVADISLLSSPYFVVLVAYFGHIKGYEISTAETNKLMWWFTSASAKGRYSRGSSEGMLDQDLKAKAPEDMIKNLVTQFGRLEIDETDLEGKGAASGFFSTMFMAMQHAGAKDWKTNLVIAPNHMHKKDKIEFHHIFPKDILKTAYAKEEINDIANLTFIGKTTNIKISNHDPLAYLEAIIEKHGDDILTKHCIPLDRNLWKLENFKEFMKARRTLIIGAFNDYLKQFS